MLKLTQWDGSGPQYVRPEAIKSMFWAHDENRTWINLGEASAQVKETPEEILAMPEMIYAMYPALNVAKDGTISKVK